MKADITDSLLDTLKHAIMMEIAGLEFFLTAAEKTTSKKAREMFRQLAEDEVEHKSLLEETLKNIVKDKGDLKVPKKRKSVKMDHPVIGKELKESLKTTWFDSSALNIGIMLEQRAVDYYREQKEKTDDPKVAELFEWLINWETEHLEALLKIDQDLKEEYWFDQGFWPLD